LVSIAVEAERIIESNRAILDICIEAAASSV